MKYEIDEQGIIWLNDGVVVPDCGSPWDEYIGWCEEGNKPTQRSEEK